MDLFNTRTALLIPLASFIFSGLVGCTKPGVYEPEEQRILFDNDLIVHQAAIGDSTSSNSIWELARSWNGRLYLRGIFHGDRFAGAISKSGDITWMRTMDDFMHGICPIPSNDFKLDDALLVTGGRDKDGDGKIDRGYIDLLGAGGISIDGLLISIPDGRANLCAVSHIDSLHFIGLGGIKKDEKTNAYLVLFHVSDDSTLSLDGSYVFEDAEDEFWTDVIMDPAGVTDSSFACYVVGDHYTDVDSIYFQTVHKVSGTRSVPFECRLDWTMDVPHESGLSIWTYYDLGLAADASSIYIVGSEEFVKEQPPAGGGFWNAGFVCCISKTGFMNWFQAVSISQHADRYYSLSVGDDYLYAIGSADRYYKIDSGDEFGLAWITVFDASTGEVRYHAALGEESCSFGLCSSIIEGSRIFCGGWRDHCKEDGGFAAWFVELDLDKLRGKFEKRFLAMPRLVDEKPVQPSERSVYRESVPRAGIW